MTSTVVYVVAAVVWGTVAVRHALETLGSQEFIIAATTLASFGLAVLYACHAFKEWKRWRAERRKR